MRLDAIPVLRPQFEMVSISPDETLVRSGVWSGLSYVLRDEKEAGTLSAVLQRIDGSRSIEAIAAEVPAAGEQEIVNLVQQLLEGGLIELNEPGSVPSSALSPVAPLLLQTTQQPLGESLNKLTSGLVGIVGSGTVAEELRAILERSGVGRVVTVTGVTPAAAGGIDAERLSFLVCALDQPDPALLAAVNRWALEEHIPWLIAAVDGVCGLIGPTVVPFETACYHCYETRLIANMTYPEPYLAARQAAAAGHPSIGARRTLPSLAAVVAGWASFEVIWGLTTGYLLTAGKQLRMNFQTGAIESVDVLKLPRCPACGPFGRQEPNAVVYKTFDTILKEMGI